MSDNEFGSDEHGDDDLRAFLRAGDPAGDLPPLDASRIAEAIAGVTTPKQQAEPVLDEMAVARARRSRRTRTGILGGTGIGVAAAAAVAVVVTSGGTGVAAMTELTNPPAAAMATPVPGGPQLPEAMCGEVTPESLRALSTAFEARVTGMADGRVVLRVTTRFKGKVEDKVTAPQQATDLPSDFSTGPLVTGRTYLIATTDGSQIAACGLSGPSSPQLRELYDEAFGH